MPAIPSNLQDSSSSEDQRGALRQSDQSYSASNLATLHQQRIPHQGNRPQRLDARATSPLISSSTRNPFSPRFIHGNSPLLSTFNFSPLTDDASIKSSPGQFEDAETEKALDSPSSQVLQDQLKSASRALEELKEAVTIQRKKRYSLLAKKKTEVRLTATGAATKLQGGLRATVVGKEADLSCLEPGDSQMRTCPTDSIPVGVGLGLILGSEPFLHQKDPLPNRRQPTPSFVPSSDLHTRQLLPTRRHLPPVRESLLTDCGTSTAAMTRTSAISNDHRALSPQPLSSPTLYSSATNTPKIDSNMFSAPSTPIPSTVLTPVLPTTTFNVPMETGFTAQRGENQAYSSSSHHDNTTIVAIASVTALGSMVCLAALVYAIFLRRRRFKKQERHLESVLDKVAPLPSPDGDNEKKLHSGLGQGGIGSIDYFNAENHTPSPALSTGPEELRMVSPWLSYDMASHPFANASTKADRFSPDLAHTGLVGQKPSRDNSFTWNFPKLSVPPAAARAMGTSHYVKKRITLPPRSITSPRLASQQTQQCEEKVNKLQGSSIRSGSIKERSDLPDLSTSASSECVDPEIDHRRKSFVNVDTPKESSGWINSALKHLVPQTKEDVVADQSIASSSPSTPWIPSLSSGRSVSENSTKSTISQGSPYTFEDVKRFSGDLALTQAVVQQVLEIRLPSLSIANSPMLDLVECSSLVFPKPPRQSPRLPSLNWGGGGGEKHGIAKGNKSTPLRSFSNETEGSSRDSGIAFHLNKETQGPRRVSWAGPLESCRESSRESVCLFEQKQPQSIRSSVRNSKATLVRQIPTWTQDVTDTEDEWREGYEAEQESETEAEVEIVVPSTPVITLTSSEEEGRLERRISLTSARDHCARKNEVNVKTKEEENTAKEADSTIIIHNQDIGSGGNDEDDLSRVEAFDCLLADDFPTIPEWTPFQTPLRSTVQPH